MSWFVFSWSLLLLGWGLAAMPAESMGYVYIPAFLGITFASVPHKFCISSASHGDS